MGKIRVSRDRALEKSYRFRRAQMDYLGRQTRFDWDVTNHYLSKVYPGHRGRFPKVFDAYPELLDLACSELEGYKRFRDTKASEYQLLLRTVRISRTLVERLARQFALDCLKH